MKLGGKSVAFVLLFVALVLVTYLASQFPARLDFTSDQIYSLSPGTRRLLGKLEEPLSFKFYFTRSGDTGQVHIQLKNYATRVEAMLRQFASASKGRVQLAVIDPQPDTDEETAAKRAGLSQKQLSSGDPFFLGLVVTQGSEERTIPYFEIPREPFLEYDIAKLVYSVQQVERPKLGLISSLPLRGAPMQMPGQQPQPDQVSVMEWENSFEVVTVEETASELPAGLGVLVVVHPQELSEKLQFAMDQFLLSGKPVVLAVDPSSYFTRMTQRPQNQMMMMQQPPQASPSNLPKLLLGYGITFDPTNVVGDLEGAMPSGTGANPAVNPTWTMANAERFNKTAQPTSSLKTMWLIEPGAFTVATDRGYEITPLIETSDRAGTVAGMMLSFMQPADISKQFKAEGGKRTVAAMLHGTFKTAFPEGAPKDPPADPASEDPTAPKPPEPAPAATTPPLQISTKPSTLVVIADSDWLLDFTSVQRIEQLDAYMPRNDNLAFSTNLADFLAGSEDLIAIRSKGRSQRPFVVMEKMRDTAQEKYQAAMTEVEKRLADIQQELNKLVQEQTSAQQLVATPEMSAAIQKFRDQEAAAVTEKRRVRRQLTVGIEKVEFTLTVANLVIVPLGIIVAGIVFFVSRHSRRKAA